MTGLRAGVLVGPAYGSTDHSTTVPSGSGGVSAAGDAAGAGSATASGSGGVSATGSVVAAGKAVKSGSGGVSATGSLAASGYDTRSGSGGVAGTGAFSGRGLAPGAVTATGPGAFSALSGISAMATL